MDRQVLLPAKVAAKLKCSRRQVYGLFARGELEGFYVGRSIKVFADSVEMYVTRHRNRPSVVPDDTEPAPAAARDRILPPIAPRQSPQATRPLTVGYRHLRPKPCSRVAR